MLVEPQPSPFPSLVLTETVFSSLVAAGALAAATLGWAALGGAAPALSAFEVGAGQGACAAPGLAPQQVVYRYVEHLGSRDVADCWSAGRGPKSLAERRDHGSAAEPIGFVIHAVQTRWEREAHLAAVEVSASWRSAPPPLWAGLAPKWILLRQQPDGRWTIDAIRREPSVSEQPDEDLAGQ